MNKPISMIINETRISLTNICKDSNLAPCILAPIIKDLYEDVNNAMQLQLKYDQEMYQKSLEENKENTNTEKESK